MERIDLKKFTDCLKKPWSYENHQWLQFFAEKMEDFIKLDSVKAEMLKNQLDNILYTIPMNDFHRIWLLSAMAEIFPDEKYLELLLQQAIFNDKLEIYDREHIGHQVECFLFRAPEYISSKIKNLQKILHQKIRSELRSQVTIHPKIKEERNEGNIILMTANFLGERHAPTHSTLERCLMAEKLFGVNVHIISTTENVIKQILPLFCYRSWRGNIIEDFNGLHWYHYKDRKYLLYQEQEYVSMPEGVQNIINYVESINPYYILYLGGESVIADLLNEFCPVMTISTVFSSIPQGNTAFKMVVRKVTDEERATTYGEIIETPFSFELTEKNSRYTRAEIGIPEDRWAMAVIGNRLDADIKVEFLEAMQQVENGFLVFIGTFTEYEKKKQEYPWLEQNSISLGWVKDVIGILECVDLYVNPRRLGGGFSVIEAFRAGIPAISIEYGDVAVAAGSAFCVADYEKMLSCIKRYQTDNVFYEQQILLAKQREKEITDQETAFKAGIEKMLSSPNFY